MKDRQVKTIKDFGECCANLITNPDNDDWMLPYNLHKHLRELVEGRGHLVDMVAILDHFISDE